MDECRRLRIEAVPKRGKDLIGVFYSKPLCAESFRHARVLDGTQFGGDPAAVTRLVPGEGDAPGFIVGEQDHKGQILAGGGLEFGDGERERPIP